MIRAEDLRYVILPGAIADPVPTAEHVAAYTLWHEVWEPTLGELDGLERLHSDDFTRQWRIGALFRGDDCLALTASNPLCFDHPAARRDSYFRAWPDETIDALIAEGTRVLVGSNVTVHRNHRGDLGKGLVLKNLVCALAAKFFIDSSFDAMSGTFRLDKGMQRVAEYVGATPLRSGVRFHGVEVVLAALFRRRLTGKPFAPEVEALWERRIDRCA